MTSGPGATNAITGLADAMMDSIPLVCITGQVPTHLIGSDAFQECDTVGITRHCTKHNYLVKSIEDLPRVLHEAFYVAQNGRPGPVVVDLPKDIQFKTGAYARPTQQPAQDISPDREGRHGSHPRRHRADGECQASGVLYGRRRRQFRPACRGAAARTRAAHRLSDHLDLDGARRLSGLGSAVGSACSACTAPTRRTSRCTNAT